MNATMTSSIQTDRTKSTEIKNSEPNSKGLHNTTDDRETKSIVSNSSDTPDSAAATAVVSDDLTIKDVQEEPKIQYQEAQQPQQGEDEFTMVTSKRAKKNRKNKKFIYKPKTLDDHVQSLGAFKTQLTGSKVWDKIREVLSKWQHHQQLQKELPTNTTTTDSTDELTNNQVDPTATNTITDIRCLALGSPTDSHIAMYQLALLQLIAEYLTVSSSKISVWDPVIAKDDLELFKHLDMNVESESEYNDTHNEGQELKPTTLVYMIHAPPSLTESVISKMKEKEDSDSCPIWWYSLFIGNVLSNYANHLLQAELDQRYPNISDAITRTITTVPSSAAATPDPSASLSSSDISTNPADIPKERWVVQEIPDQLSTSEPWAFAVNDLAVYWRA